MGLKRVSFDGCALGLRDPKTRKYIRKPWAFSTSVPEIVEKFQVAKCTCPPNSHIRCKGSLAELSAYYTWKMTDWMHECITNSINTLRGTSIPQASRPEEKIVKSLKRSGWHDIRSSKFHVQENATQPRKLSPQFAKARWPRRSTYALTPSLGTGEWIQIEDKGCFWQLSTVPIKVWEVFQKYFCSFAFVGTLRICWHYLAYALLLHTLHVGLESCEQLPTWEFR